MKLNGKTFHAIANLGKHFWLHVFRRAVSKPKPGEELRKFRDNYADDNLAPLRPEEAAALPEFQKCINCGSCSAVCPVYTPVQAGAYRGPDSITAALSRSFPDFGSARDAVYNCTQCGACATACPRGIDIPELILMVRRKAVEIGDDKIIEQYTPVVEGVTMAGNVYGRCCSDFSAFENPGADILYFIGCTGLHRTQVSTRKTLELLKSLGVNFTVMSENCCGGFHRSIGIRLDEGIVTEYNPSVQATLEGIRAAAPKKLVTGCPHAYEIFTRCEPYKSELRKLGVEVQFVSELLAGLEFDVESVGEKVAYHDPCFLGRRNGIFDSPRELIRRTGVEPLELEQCREDSLCCGSKDGTFIIDEKVAAAVAAKRLKQAEHTGAEVLLTECPGCLATFNKYKTGEMRVELVSAYISDRLMKS